MEDIEKNIADSEWEINDIKNRVSDKAYAKVTMLNIEISDNKMDLVTGNYAPINYEQMLLVLESNKKELKIWQYIAELIENK
jgi:hypothetical protein